MFRGVLVPALVICSSKGSITSDILTVAFKRLDDLRIYRRNPNLKPLALFDAHDSRLQAPFLRHINSTSNRWVFCIGLPNGTHKWQVGDSQEQNGSYKVEWYREKTKVVLYKIRMEMGAVLSKNDILPLVNLVWDLSFGRVRTNKKAISDRGWNPANHRLLTDPDILKSKVLNTEPHYLIIPPTTKQILPIVLLPIPPIALSLQLQQNPPITLLLPLPLYLLCRLQIVPLHQLFRLPIVPLHRLFYC